MSIRARVPLLGALLLLLAAALATALVPAGLALDRRVASELRSAAVEDLERAPMILMDRNTAREEALTMHARSVADTEGLMEAVDAGRLDVAADLVRATASMYDEDPVLVDAEGSPVVGPTLDRAILDAVRIGDGLVEYVYHDGVPQVVGLVSLAGPEGWMGAAGSSTQLDSAQTTALSALSRAEVTIVGPDGRVVTSTLDAASASAVATAEAAAVRAPEQKVVEASVRGAPTWIARGELAGAGSVLFTRDVGTELSALPTVRRGALLAAFLTLVLALGVGSVVALTLTRPVGTLAAAAAGVAKGDFDAPLPRSRIDELDRLAASFGSMRESLRSRIEELAAANRQLEDRQQRLHELQSELIQQDRVASSARMAAELAHEIRNPVANVRNCLEVVRRGLPGDSEGARFADMAIDELLRMHEMAEHLLDLNRPADPTAPTCDAAEVARRVATLSGVGDGRGPIDVVVASDGVVAAAIPPDALKQVLFNLVDNAREAVANAADVGARDDPDPITDPEADVCIRVGTTNGTVTIDVLDRGPGIEAGVLPHVFDPFFTTKDAVTGVGLGLSVAQGIARRHGGRMEAENRDDGPGARFRLEVPSSGP